MTREIAGSRVLVTGGAGFVGSHIVDLLVREHVGEVVVIDNLVRGRREHLAPAAASGRVVFVEGTIADSDLVRRHMAGIDYVFHEAALRITYLGINRGDEHRHRLQVWNAGSDCESPCELRVDYHGKEGIWPLREPQQRVLASASNFTLPRALLTLSAVKIDRLDLRWRREEQLSGGALTLCGAQAMKASEARKKIKTMRNCGGAERAENSGTTATKPSVRSRKNSHTWAAPSPRVNTSTFLSGNSVAYRRLIPG